jgi:hypothetical protein
MRGCIGYVAACLTVAGLMALTGCDANLGDGEGDSDATLPGQPDAAPVVDAPPAPDAEDNADAAPPADARPCVEGDDRVVGSNGNCYIYVATGTAWADAQTACVGLGGHLATSASQVENDDFSPMAGQLDVWIGGTDDPTENLWRWINGEAMGYTNWRTDEPNNGNGNFEEDCMIIEGDNGGLWDDRPCDTLFGFICERE